MAVISCVIVALLLSAFANGNEEHGSDKVLICTLDIGATNRIGPTNFTPEDLDPNLCTHVIYNKAVVDNTNHDIIPHRPEIDLYENGGKGMYNRTMKLKEVNPQLKIILQFCCTRDEFWDTSTITTSMIISKFIKNAVKFMRLHGFDGLYVTMEDSPHMLRLLTELRVEFNKYGYILSIYIFPESPPVTPGLPLTLENSEPFDLVILGTNLLWHTDTTTIFSSLTELRRKVSEYKILGIPSEKMVVTIPTFAVSYKLCNGSDTGLSAEICGPGDEGTSDAPENIILYYELMRKMSNASEGWVVERDNATGMLYGHSKSLLWTSYEDPVSVRAKVQYAIEENLAGVTIITVDMDDTVGYKDGVKLPLTRAAHDALRGN